MKASSTGWAVVKWPPETDGFNCESANVVALTGDYGTGTKLSDVGKSMSDLPLSGHDPWSTYADACSHPARDGPPDWSLRFGQVPRLHDRRAEHRGHLRRHRERPGPDLHHDGRVQLRPRRGRDAGRVPLLADDDRVGLARAGGHRGHPPGGRAAVRRPARARHLPWAGGNQRGHQAGGLHLVAGGHDRPVAVDLGAERGPGGAAVLRRAQAEPGPHHDHLPPAHHHRRGRSRGHRPAPAAVSHPCGRGHAGRGG